MLPPAPSGSFGLARTRLFDLDFVDAPDVAVVLDAIFEAEPQAEEVLPLVLTPNVDHLVQLRRAEPAIVESTRAAAVLLPDGQPIVWASRLLGTPLTARLTGSDLFPRLWQRLAGTGEPVLVVAPSDRVAERLRAEHANATVVVAPIFAGEDRAARDRLVAECITALDGDPIRHVVVAIGQPKQQLVALDLLEGWPEDRAPFVYCVGAAPEMYLGMESRAPTWMQRAGLEWMYRFVRQPRRLFRRYFIDDVAFAGIVFREWRARRSQG